jgi:hypothetical protein
MQILQPKQTNRLSFAQSEKPGAVDKESSKKVGIAGPAWPGMMIDELKREAAPVFQQCGVGMLGAVRHVV